MRRHTDFSGYNRSIAFFKPSEDRQVLSNNALKAFAANEAQFIFLFLKFAGAIDDEVSGRRWTRGTGWEVPSPDSRDVRKALEVML